MDRLLLALGIAALATAPAAAQFRGFIYPAPTEPLSLERLPDGAALVRVITAGRLTLAGVEIAGHADRPVLLVFHGNGSDADGAMEWFAPLAAAGYGIVAAEYRGYSANPGRPDEAGLAADADAFFARAKALAAGRRLIVIGHSLGGGVAFGLARRQTLDALVTIGTFTRLRAMAPRMARAFIADRYDNEAAVRVLDEPLFLVHGTADDTVSPAEFNTLGRAAIAAKRSGAGFVLEGADHHPAGDMIKAVIDVVTATIANRPPPALPAGVRKLPYSPGRPG